MLCSRAYIYIVIWVKDETFKIIKYIYIYIYTLDHTIRIGSTPTFLYFDLYLYSAYAAHYVYICICIYTYIQIIHTYIHIFLAQSSSPGLLVLPLLESLHQIDLETVSFPARTGLSIFEWFQSVWHASVAPLLRGIWLLLLGRISKAAKNNNLPLIRHPSAPGKIVRSSPLILCKHAYYIQPNV